MCLVQLNNLLLAEMNETLKKKPSIKDKNYKKDFCQL